ncbi:MAG: EAL domain-containing protein, partial [Chloroflexi bacterium]|nr:EAL domain-containing protein [Chloroflexota bacterium]
LGERLKELTCLYGVVDLLRDGSPIEKVAWDIANLIPLGWQYPDIAVARVSFDQLSFQTEAFVSTEWKLASDIIVDGQTRGLVEICYTEPKPLADEGPFLAEERNLIDRIAKLLADAIESRAAGERVRLQGAAVDASVDAIIAANRSGEIMLANPAAAAMFGRATAADLVGTALLNLMPEGFRADHLQGLARLNRGDSPKVLGRTVEVEGLKADGQIFPLEISINKLDGSGKADYVAVLRDITERRETERDSRLRSAALGAASDMIVITGSDGVIEYVNDAFTRETGYTPAEVVGANPRTWKSETQDPAYYIQLWSTIKAGRVWKGELINRRKNGTVFIEEMTITPIHDDDGEISNFVAIKRDISERKRNEEDLLRLATTDTLTGLLNRHQFNVQLEQAVELLRRREAQGALITMDLDGFKYINDAYGHGAGDELLALIARDLQQRLRASDPVARIGGDEFAVILHDASPDDGLDIAEELVALIANCSLEIDGQQVSITASAGVAALPDGEASPADLMAFADIALYAAKDIGRGRAVLYSDLDEGRDTISSLQRTRTMIVDALRNDRIKIHWQPIFNTIDLQPYEYEVLARLEDSDGTLRFPADFMPQAEALDLMGDIDRRVIDLALRAGADNHRNGQPVRLAVNISARSLTSEMVDYIVEAADESGYPLSILTVEITETAVLAVNSETKAAIERLVGAGVSLSMDDFGSGATSFGNLEALPFKYMKLDGSYVQDLATNKRGRELVTGLTQLAHTLGLEVVAEYVQDDETIEFLREIGVEYLQGFHLGEPVPVPAPSK